MKRFSQLTQIASEADLVAGNFLAIDVTGVLGVTKKVPGNLVAPKSLAELKANKSDVFPYMDFTDTTVRYIRGDGIWGGKSMHNHICVPVTNQTKFILKANASMTTYYAFLKSYSKATVESDSPGSADLCEGYTTESSVPAASFNAIDIPVDCNWVYVRVDSNGTARPPQYAYIANSTNVVYRLQNLEEDTAVLKDAAKSLEGMGSGSGHTSASSAYPMRTDLMPFEFINGHKYAIAVSFNRNDFNSYFTIRSGTMDNSERLSSNFGYGTDDRLVEIDIEWNNATVLGWHVSQVSVDDPVAGQTVTCTAYIYDVTETNDLSSIIPRMFIIESEMASTLSRVDEIEEKLLGISSNNVDMSLYTPVIRRISEGGTSWGNKTVDNHICIPITGDVDRVRIKSSVNYSAIFAFLKTYDAAAVVGENPPVPDFATGWTKPVVIPKNSKAVSVNIPEDAAYLYLQVDYGFDYERYPKELGIYKEEANIEARVEKLENNQGVYDFIGLNSLTTVCHRGNCGVANVPENSVHSITNAAMQGQKFVECDVKKTADDEYVIMHDNTINRTMVMADGSAIVGDVSVSSKTLSELETLYKYKTSVEKYATKITTLDEWLTRVKQLGLIPVLHNIPSALIPHVIEVIGENFIYMGQLTGCHAVRTYSKKCFIMYQYAAQEDANHAIADADVPAVIADMISLGGSVGYSSLYAATFSDTFITALKKNGFYFQYSTQAPKQSSEFIAKGALFVLTNNWHNDKLSYGVVYRMADDLSNITHDHEENGCLKLLSGESVSVSGLSCNSNIKIMLTCNGSLNVGIGGIIIPVSGNGSFVVGVNVPAGTQSVTLSAVSDTIVSELETLTN